MNTVTKTQAMDKIQEIESALASIAFYVDQQANTQQESEYITAEQARELVRNGGEAEYSFDNVVWYTCMEDSSYRPLGIKYRAIKAQPEPADNDTAFLKRFKENVLADVNRALQPETIIKQFGTIYEKNGDMVTDELVKEYDRLCYDEDATPKQHLAAVINAWGAKQ